MGLSCRELILMDFIVTKHFILLKAIYNSSCFVNMNRISMKSWLSRLVKKYIMLWTRFLGTAAIFLFITILVLFVWCGPGVTDLLITLCVPGMAKKAKQFCLIIVAKAEWWSNQKVRFNFLCDFWNMVTDIWYSL
jgi:hypothetical protein